MTKIIFSLEYGTYPIWIQPDNDVSIPELPKEWEGDEWLKCKLDEIQSLYESLFVNDLHIKFHYEGPKSKDEQKRINDLIEEVREYIKKIIPPNYVFVDTVSHSPF